MRHCNRLNYILLTYAAGIGVFTLFRIACTLTYCLGAETWPDFGGQYPRALLNGWRFDTAVSCYVLALPILLLAAAEIGRIRSRQYHEIVHHVVLVCYIVCFFACAADIPFFNYFFTRLNATAANEADSMDIILNMIVSEPSYVLWFLVFAGVSAGYWFLMRAIFRRTLGRVGEEGPAPLWAVLPLSAAVVFATFYGMRGRPFRYCPLRVATAYYCSDPFLNMIGLNPVFTFVKSAGEVRKAGNEPVALADRGEAEAVFDAERRLPADEGLVPAGLRLPLPEGMNVVLVLMESMSANKTALAGGGASLTPCLDSLMDSSLTFTRLYSSGIHTYNGIYSLLYAHPCSPGRHTMKHTSVPRMHGLPDALKERGYQTAYFLTHDEYFDNLRVFLYGNGFDSIFGLSHYPAATPRGCWGVPDHYMFDSALRYCGRAARRGPFFCVMMTCSDHPPYLFPEGVPLRTRSEGLEQRMAEYADWAIGRFVRMARQQTWFENTLFVFVGDHGQLWGSSPYDVALSYHHVPLLFYCPGRLLPQRCARLATQMDLCPTLLGMFSSARRDSNFGLDLLRQQRRFAYFVEDDKICVMDDSCLFVHRTAEEHESLYRYSDSTPGDRIAQCRPMADTMRRYAFGMIQQAYNMITIKPCTSF